MPEIAMSRARTRRTDGPESGDLRMFLYVLPPFDEIAIAAVSEDVAIGVVMERYRVPTRDRLPAAGKLIPAPQISSGEVDGVINDYVDRSINFGDTTSVTA